MIVAVSPASAYVLEFSVPPDGSRRGDVYAYARVDQLRSCLEQERLAQDMDVRTVAAHDAVWFGATIVLWIVQRGRIREYQEERTDA